MYGKEANSGLNMRYLFSESCYIAKNDSENLVLLTATVWLRSIGMELYLKKSLNSTMEKELKIMALRHVCDFMNNFPLIIYASSFHSQRE